ncbi:PIN domain-like protein [Haematococcus lacustris]
MGISGLLPILKPIARLRHLREYRGKRVAVDAYSWLHKGAYTCSRELCEGVFTDKFVFYCMSRIQLMLSNGVVPVVVFDGCRMPSKNDEEEARRRSRRENRERALTHLQMGNLAAAEECFQRSVDVTPAMAKQFIEALKDKGVAFVVAPYEADAQMAYLALNGDVWAVVTEDSDLLAYGCPRVLYKLDKMGNGEEICLDDLPLNQGVSFMGFSHTMFLEMCIMAGCDFLPSLPGIGAKRAYAHMKKFRSFVKVCKSLRFGGTAVPRDYEERFQLALWVFRHQRVFCKDLQGCTHLRPLPPGGIGMADVDVPSAVPQPTLLPPPSNSPEDIDQFDAQQAALSDPLAFLGPWLPDSIAPHPAMQCHAATASCLAARRRAGGTRQKASGTGGTPSLSQRGCQAG